MANIDSPFGLKPVRHMNGNPYNGASNMYLLPAALDGIFKVGDPVLHGGTSGAAGTIVGGINCEGMPTIAAFTGGAPLIVGVIVGFIGASNPAGAVAGNVHRPASTAMIALVADDPHLIFEAQEDSLGGAAITAAQVGANFDLSSPSTGTGLSEVEIDTSQTNTTVLNVQVLRLVPRPDNVIGTNAKYEVRILEHMYAGTTGI